MMTSQLALSAAHCVAGVPKNDWSTNVSLAIGHQAVPATVIDLAPDSDVALIQLKSPIAVELESSSLGFGRRGDEWYAPARPTSADPELTGEIASTLIFTCAAGGDIQALQLTTASDLSNYSGYSGGPVLRLPEEDSSVLGLLIEQYPDRYNPSRASNTLFAVSIRHALELFPRLSHLVLLEELIKLNRGGPRLFSLGSPTPSGEPRAAHELASPQPVAVGGGTVTNSTHPDDHRSVLEGIRGYLEESYIDSITLGLHETRVPDWALAEDDSDD